MLRRGPLSACNTSSSSDLPRVHDAESLAEGEEGLRFFALLPLEERAVHVEELEPLEQMRLELRLRAELGHPSVDRVERGEGIHDHHLEQVGILHPRVVPGVVEVAADPVAHHAPLCLDVIPVEHTWAGRGV
eukprot:2118879-Prymnesium_polylepis.1